MVPGGHGDGGVEVRADGDDEAGRLTSWDNGSTTTGYGYDGAGNRTSVTAGGSTATASYDARDRLSGTTSGTVGTTYTYTARGTMSEVSGPSGTEGLSYDAFDQLTSDGTTAYSHDAFGRQATAGSSTFGYDGTDSRIVSDGTETYGRGPGGGLLSVGDSGGSALARTDQHGDLTATFTASGTGLAGSTAYDPYGQTVAASGTQHDLGYQGGWTDPGSGRVATASRWYDPATGAFTTHDATSQPPSPSANANPFAYAADDPVNNADPSGASACYTTPYSAPAPHGVPVTVGASGGTSSYPQMDMSAKQRALDYEMERWDASLGSVTAAHTAAGTGSSSVNMAQRVVHKVRSTVGSVNRNVSSALGNGTAAKIAGGVVAGATLAALGSMSLALFGYGSCDVSVYQPPAPPPPTAETGLHENPGVRPVGQATGPGTVPQPGTKTADTGPGVTAPVRPTGQAPAAAAPYSPAVNAAPAAMAAAPAATGLGTTLPIDPSAGSGLTLVDPLDPTAGAGSTLVTPAQAGAGITLTTPVDLNAGLPSILTFPAIPHTGLGSTLMVGELPSVDGEGCSFSPETPVLLDHGKTKPIGKVGPGDKVEAADPKTGKHAGSRAVTATWINHDSDLTDVTVRGADGKAGTLHTTANHPFWDDTVHAWVPAGKLKPGHVLNTATNTHATVLSTHPTPGTATRYNLTVNDLHTYYVLAGGVPILVHNSCGPDGEHVVLGVGEHSDALAGALRNAGDTGAYTFNDSNFGDVGEGGIPEWMHGVMRAAGSPDTRLSITLDGLPGATPEETFQNAYVRGAGAGLKGAVQGGYGTAWEMSVVGRNSYLNSVDSEFGRSWSSIQFYWRSAPVDVQEPDWAALRGLAGQ